MSACTHGAPACSECFHGPGPVDFEIGQGGTTLDMLRHSYPWLGEMIDEIKRERGEAQMEAGRLQAENEELHDQIVDLQEIAVRVKLGQLEVWPDASQTEIGKALTAARKEFAALAAERDALKLMVERYKHGVNVAGGGTLFGDKETAQLCRQKLAERNRLLEHNKALVDSNRRLDELVKFREGEIVILHNEVQELITERSKKENAT